MNPIFISYSTRDGTAIAKALVAALEGAGERCWIAPRNMKAGVDYPTAIVRAIRDCRGLVVLITPSANESQDILQEVQRAHDERKPLFPLIVHGTRPSDGLSYFLNVRQQIPWSDARETAAALRSAMEPGTGTKRAAHPGVSAVPAYASSKAPASAFWTRLPALARAAAVAVVAVLAVVGARTLFVRKSTPPLALQQPAAVSSPMPLVHSASPQDSPPLSPVEAAGKPRAPDHMAALGDSYLQGTDGHEQNDVEAMRYYQSAADQGDARGLAGLGFMYQYGRGGLPRDEAKAASLLQRSADQGDAFGQACLGVMYYSGRGLPKNTAKAVSLFQKSNQQGNSLAKAGLGAANLKGEGGLVKNVPEGVRLLRQSAQVGDPFGQAQLAVVYLEGTAVPKNEAEALHLAQLSAKQNNLAGLSVLGFMYLQGLGMPKNEREAANCFKQAAHQGEPLGQTFLGFLYVNGRGGLAKNCTQGMELLLEGARHGTTAAQLYLGEIYQQGGVCGVRKDDATSQQWYREAAHNGNLKAQNYLRSRSLSW